MTRRPPATAPRPRGRLRTHDDDDGADRPHYQTGHDYPAPGLAEEDGSWPAARAPAASAGQPRAEHTHTTGEPSRTRPRPAPRPPPEPEPDLPPPAHDEDEEDDGEQTRAGPPLTLEVIAGKSKGRKRRFSGVRMVIGRSPECEFHIPDPSVSRRHLELVQDESGVLMRDLGSGNGTRVNGEVTSERILEHGDEIDLGQTTIRFVDEIAAVRIAREEAARREEEDRLAQEEEAKRLEEEERLAEEEEARFAEEQARIEQETFNRTLPGRVLTMTTKVGDAYRGTAMRTRMAIGGGLVLLVLLFFGGKALFADSGPPPPDPRLLLAQEKLAAGDAARAEGRLTDAIILYTDAERTFPGVDDGQRARSAREERDAMEVVDKARKQLEARQYVEARQTLAQVADVSASITNTARELLAEIETAELDEKKAEVEHALNAGDLDGAMIAIGALPEALRGTYLNRISEMESREALVEEVSAEQQRRAGEAARRRRQAARAEAMAHAFVNVSRKFHAGEYARAAQECDRVVETHRSDPDIRDRAVRIQRLIPQFQTNYEDGMLKLRSGAPAAAARPLRKARDLLDEIGLPGVLTRDVNALLARTASAAGESALRRNDLETAFSAFQEASRLNPSDATAREGLVQIRSRAQQLYYEGYQVRDRDPQTTLRKFRIVVQIAEPGSDIAMKAEAYLNQSAP